MKLKLLALATSLFIMSGASAGQSKMPLHRLSPLAIHSVTINDDFWTPKINVWRSVTIQDCFAKFDSDRAFDNFDRVRDGKIGDHHGPQWYDGLIYEMIRAGSDFLAAHPDPKLEKQIDGYICRIAEAANRDPHGYIETWTLLMEPNHRWGLNGGNDVSQHELYNAGALIEAGIHWRQATGRTDLLNVAVKMANDMCDTMGPGPKINQAPGHPLGEEALINLYLLFKTHPNLKSQIGVSVDERRYLELAQYWIDIRGNHNGRPLNWGTYAQDDKPIRDQKEIEGHAVRATLLCSGITEAGNITGRADYLETSQRLWKSMADRKMYITGGMGSTSSGEAFGKDYDLPNRSAYAETCAAVGAAFFDHNMNMTFANARYADELERELYNGALVGVSLKGNRYFYDNPLETGSEHQRWSWHGCPCCPPMFLKLMSALPSYIYAQASNTAYVNLFIGSHARMSLNGVKVSLVLTTEYPRAGDVKIAVQPQKPIKFDIDIRVPSWSQPNTSSSALYREIGPSSKTNVEISVNGKKIAPIDIVHGYARLRRQWKKGDVIDFTLDMRVRKIQANSLVKEDRGLVALMRGPVVYCVENIDNHFDLRQLILDPQAHCSVKYEPNILGGATIIRAQAYTRQIANGVSKTMPTQLVAIPYYAQANRKTTSMRVWIASSPAKASPVTLASRSRASASYCWSGDSVEAVNDGVIPQKSSDINLPRLSWWDHKGSKEWAQLDFPAPASISKARIFWFADKAAHGGCDVPESWRLLYKDGDQWKHVQNPDHYGVMYDSFNEVNFTSVKTTALRVLVKLKPNWSGGIYEWQAE